MAEGKHLRDDPGPAADRSGYRPLLVATACVFVVAAVVVFLDRGDDRVSADGTATAAPPSTDLVPSTPTIETVTPTSRDPRGSGQSITIAFGGDSFAEGVLADRLASRPAEFVGPYADVFRSADLSILNLETAITTGNTRIPGKQFAFAAPPSVLDAIAAGGVDVVSLANNHGMDYGEAGLADSIAAKRASGMVVGVGADEAEAYAPWVTEIKGQKIAVIGATQVLDDSLRAAWTATTDKGGLASAKRVDRLVEEIRSIRDEVDTIVVYLHWGIETHECPSAVQQELAVTLEAAGADLLVGGHAHRVQGGGMLGTAAVHYGLGNFLFKENSAPGARTGVFVVTVTGQEVDGYEWIPGRVRNSIPIPLEGREAADELARWNSQRDCTNLTA